MKNIEHTKYGFKTLEVWFLSSEEKYREIISSTSYDRYIFREAKINPNNEFQCFKNGVISLDRAEDEIFLSFISKFRNESKRAQKEGVCFHIVEPHDNDTFELIYNRYVEFTNEKNLGHISKNVLDVYRHNNVLGITYTKFQESLINAHIYFYSSSEAILLASFPFKSTAIGNNMFGWSNRYLHWQDMVYFKSLGLLTYNLGGIGNSVTNSNESIIKFKMEMNPMVVPYHNHTITSNKIYNIVKKVKNVFKNHR